MTHLAACILALSVLRIAPSGPVYSRQMRSEGAEARAVWLAESVDRAARVHGVKPLSLLALLWLEAAFDRDRVSPVGCVGIAQSCGRMKSAYLRACDLMHPWSCDAVSISLAAREMSQGLRICGSEAGALSWYRYGDCSHAHEWRVRQVLALAAELEWGAT
jgi:hypothetical protein